MKIRQEYDQRCQQHKAEILELAGKNAELSRQLEESAAANQSRLKELASENEQLRRQLEEMPKASTGTGELDLSEYKKFFLRGKPVIHLLHLEEAANSAGVTLIGTEHSSDGRKGRRPKNG